MSENTVYPRPVTQTKSMSCANNSWQRTQMNRTSFNESNLSKRGNVGSNPGISRNTLNAAILSSNANTLAAVGSPGISRNTLNAAILGASSPVGVKSTPSSGLVRSPSTSSTASPGMPPNRRNSSSVEVFDERNGAFALGGHDNGENNPYLKIMLGSGPPSESEWDEYEDNDDDDDGMSYDTAGDTSDAEGEKKKDAGDNKRGSFHDLFFLCEEGSYEEIAGFLGILESGYFGYDVDVNTRSDAGYTALHVACYKGRGDVVTLLLEHGADPNRQDFKLGTPLLMCVKMNNAGAFNALTGAAVAGHVFLDPNIADVNGATPLFLACANGLEGMVWRLLALGADYRRTGSFGGVTPLYAAAKLGYMNIVQGLLRAGADPNEPLGNGDTALLAALKGRRHAMAVGLLAAGANPVQANAAGVTPLHVAMFAGDADVVELLLRGGAGACVSAPNRLGITPLHIAIGAGDEGLARRFLDDYGADPNASYGPASTPLYVACCARSAAAARLLLERGADPNRMTSAGLRPLQIAVRNGADDVLYELLAYGADPSDGDEVGVTPLHVAAAAGNMQALRLLLMAGADPNARTAVGTTPLFFAAERGRADAAEALLAAGAAARTKADTGETPLLLAARAGNRRIVEMLLPYVNDIDGESANGDYPLLAATRGGFTDVVELLLAAGAGIPRENETELGPLWYACMNNNLEIIELLLECGSNPTSQMAASTNATVNMLLVMYGSRTLPPALAKSAGGSVVTLLIQTLLDKKVNPYLFKLPALGMPLEIIHNNAYNLRYLTNPTFYRAIDPDLIVIHNKYTRLFLFILFLKDVDTRDENGETLLHWAMKYASKDVITELIERGFDIEARNYTNASTPLFCLQDKSTFRELLYKYGDGHTINRDGRMLRMLLNPNSNVPQARVKTVRVALVGEEKYSPRASYTAAEGFILGVTLAGQKTRGPRGCRDPLRPGRFAWSSRPLTGAIAAAVREEEAAAAAAAAGSGSVSSVRPAKKGGRRRAPKFMPLVWYDTLPGDEEAKLCVQVGDYRWYREHDEAADCIVFLHSVDTPASLCSLASRMVPKLLRGYRYTPEECDDSDDEDGNTSSGSGGGEYGWAQSVWKATRVMAGVGREACGAGAKLDTRKHGQVRTPAQCRRIAEYCQMHGYTEGEKTPDGFRALLYEAVKIHAKLGARIGGAGTVATVAAKTEIALGGGTAILGVPFPYEDKPQQVKMLLLGHQESGKSSLLKNLVKEDINAGKSYAASKFELLKHRMGYGSDADKKVDLEAYVHRAAELKNLVPDCTLKVVDFAGQMECMSAYDIFFSQFNTVYVIAVNAATNTIAQLRHWLEVLEQSPRGPYIDCALVIVCTMSDLVLNGATAKEVEITHEVQRWNISKRMPVRIVMASNKTGDGIKTVSSVISGFAKAIAARKVPKIFREAQKIMEEISPELISVTCTSSQITTVNIFLYKKTPKYLFPIIIAYYLIFILFYSTLNQMILLIN